MLYLKHYTTSIQPNKTNVIADALSRKSTIMIANLMVKEGCLLEKFRYLSPEFKDKGIKIMVSNIRDWSSIPQEIEEAQHHYPQLISIKEEIQRNNKPDFETREEGSLRFKVRLDTPYDPNLNNEILNEAHQSHYTIHSDKMYQDLR